MIFILKNYCGIFKYEFFVIKTIVELISDKSKYNDIITPNVENFLEIAKHIYPTEILLEQTHNDSLHDTFLNLDISVVLFQSISQSGTI